MPEDNTMMLKKADGQESKIFNTSVRGWIALIGMAGLSAFIGLIVVAPYFSVEIPQSISNQLVTLFISSVTAAIVHYFQQGSKEGQK